jgi:tetratricopeptide (TPR) repeat protein
MIEAQRNQTTPARRPLALERGLALYAGGNLNAARMTLETLLGEQPACLEALNALGTLHLELDQPGPAYFYFSRALRHDAANPVLLMQVSECQRALGDEAGASESYERAKAIFNKPVAPPPVEVATAPYACFETFLDGIELPPTALAAVPVSTRDRGTQPLWLEPWAV